MRPSLGDVVQVRAGAYSVQDRCAAIVTQIHSETIVDLTVFPGDGVAPFTMRAVKRAAEDHREFSNKEMFWHFSPEA